MTSIQLKEERDSLLAELTGIDALSKEEKRELTEDEETRTDEITAKVDELDSKIEKAEKREAALAKAAKAQSKANKGEEGEKEKVKESFSMTRAIKTIISGKNLDGAEAEMYQEAKNEARQFGGDVVGNIAVPSFILEKRTDVSQTTSAIQPTEVGAYVDALRENAVYEKVGATVYNGLTGDFKIPIVGAQSLAWASAENSAAADGGANFTSITLNPTRLTGYVDVSQRVILQNGQAAVQSIMKDLGRETANKLSDAMFSTAAVSNAPASLGSQTGIGTFTEASYSANASIFSDLVEAEQTLADAEGLNGNLAYVLSTKLMSDLKKSAQVASVNPAMSNFSKGEANLNGYKSVFTTSCSNATGTGDGYFGNFAHWHVGFFGGLSMSIDPYSVLLNDQIRIVVHRNVDFDASQVTSFVKFTSATA